MKKTSKPKTLNKIGSDFGLSAREIRELMDDGDTEKSVSQFQRKMFNTLVRLLPIAEKAYRRNPTQSMGFALNGLISQTRELGHDLQATADRQQLARRLASEVLEPAFRAMAHNMVDTHHSFKRTVETRLKTPHVARTSADLDAMTAGIAKHCQEQYASVVAEIEKLLVN